MTISSKSVLIGLISSAGVIGLMMGNFFLPALFFASAAISCNVL